MKCIKHKWQYNPALVAINYSFFLEYQDSNNLKTYPLPAGLCSFPAILAQILGLKLVIRKTVNFSTECKINLPTHVFVLTVYDMQGLENTTSGVGITSQCHTSKLRWGSVILSENFSCMNVPMSRESHLRHHRVSMAWYTADKHAKGSVGGMFPSVESAGVQAGYPILDTQLQALNLFYRQ